jgi:BlaR1 peptidase M56
VASARAFGHAASRYRLLAVAFAVVAAVGPASLAVAALRPAAFVAGTPGAAPDPVRLAALPLLAVALAMAAALLLELIFDVIRLRHIKQTADPLGRVPVRGAWIGSSPTVPTPTAIGYLHPAIVVPAGFRDRVDAGEWDAVVAHECAHLARRDDWAKALQSAVLRAAWWLPGLWIISRALDLERELASDERAAAATSSRRYAACLLRLATDPYRDAISPALWGRRSHVAIRVERLLRPTPPGSPILRAVALGAFTAAVIAIVSAAISAVPGFGYRTVRAAAHHAPQAAIRPHRPHPPTTRPVARLPLRTALHVTKVVTLVPVQIAALAEPLPIVRLQPRRHARPAPDSHHAAASARPKSVAGRRPGPAVAYSAGRVRCATCFGPLRSPDDSYWPPTSASPALATSTAAIASEDTGSGPATTHAGFLQLHLPRALTPP